MKKILAIIAMMVLTLPTIAQENRQGRFNPEEFRAKMEEYISQKACLSAQEAKAVFPILHEMKEKQRELNKKTRELKQNAKNQNLSDSEYSDLISKINENNLEAAKLQNSYYKKMCKAISPKKVYAIMLAEDSFHRDMLQKFAPGKRGGHPGGKGGPRR